jgi:hypothetical protein
MTCDQMAAIASLMASCALCRKISAGFGEAALGLGEN